MRYLRGVALILGTVGVAAAWFMIAAAFLALFGCDPVERALDPTSRTEEPRSLALLAPEDQAYVRAHTCDYRFGRRHQSYARLPCTIEIGTGWPAGELRASVLVHEACHLEHRHTGCVPAQEEQCSLLAADASRRAGFSRGLIEHWMRQKGQHCK